MKGLTTLPSGVVAGFVRDYASFNFVFLVLRRLSIALAHLPSYGTEPFKFEGGEGIRGLFGSEVSTSSSLDACSGRPEISAPVQLLQSDYISGQDWRRSLCNLQLTFQHSEMSSFLSPLSLRNNVPNLSESLLTLQML